MDIIERKIIAILSKSSVIINYGREDGASKKDIIRVIERGPKVEYKGTNYGTLDNIKAELVVQTIYENFSVCINSQTTNAMSQGLPINQIPALRSYHKDLKVNEEEIKNLEIPTGDTINLGDLVEIIKF